MIYSDEINQIKYTAFDVADAWALMPCRSTGTMKVEVFSIHV
jgi:hypothetical protein